MISGWKIKRELGRMGQQLRGISDRVTDPIAQRRLDRTVAAGLPTTPGELAVVGKVGLFLLYQPKGISASTLETCRLLAKAGYSPLIVSNSPISNEDKQRLIPLAWQIIERPNFGYDFGGYRDGLTHLQQSGASPNELLILNDSVWLGIVPTTDLFARLDADPADIAGTILRDRGTERFLESYLFRLRRPALEHPAFVKFWTDLRLTSNKYHVIRRGERGFSAAMRSAGLRVSGVYKNANFLQKLTEQDDEFLRITLQYSAYADTKAENRSQELLNNYEPDWRETVLQHFEDTLSKRQAYSSFPYANVHLTGYPFLKKSADPVIKAWRQAYLKAVQANDLPPPPPHLSTEIFTCDNT